MFKELLMRILLFGRPLKLPKHKVQRVLTTCTRESHSVIAVRVGNYLAWHTTPQFQTAKNLQHKKHKTQNTHTPKENHPDTSTLLTTLVENGR